MSKHKGLLAEIIGSGEDLGETDARSIRAIAWARVSTDMQEERGLSIPEQLREICVYAERRGIEIVEEFSEAASAYQKEEKRVEFRRMLVAAKSTPRVNAILVHDFSRFSRDSVRAKALVRELRQAGIRVISLNDPEVDPESVAGVYMEAITFAKNEAYSREIAFHTRKGCRGNVQTRDAETRWCYKNGGQPPWGYRSQQLARGEERKGIPIIKTIWVLDDTMVAGRPVHKWVRHCLVKLAAKGASLDELRDFCNQRGIPGRRKQYWSTSTWNALLRPHCLLKYCGYEVWNVHRKNGTIRPASEWVIAEDAHEAIITEDEAKAILAARRNQSRQKRFDRGYGKSRTSPYLLSGGLFRCERCGSNMIGRRTSHGRYYVCGSQPYRGGMGCGRGVYVPQDAVEAEAVTGLRGLLGVCTDPKGFARQVNEELRRLWQDSTGHDPRAQRKIEAIDAKIANIRRAVEDGLSDAAWANARLAELQAQRRQLADCVVESGQPPQIDVDAALSYRHQIDKVLARGEPVERKQMLRTWVQEMTLAPERLEVEIQYRLPEPVVNGVVAGAGTGEAQITRPYRWGIQIGFRMLPRPVTTCVSEPVMRKAPPPKKPSRRKVGGRERVTCSR